MLRNDEKMGGVKYRTIQEEKRLEAAKDLRLSAASRVTINVQPESQWNGVDQSIFTCLNGFGTDY